ncbi:MAG TPA: VanZ family protein [Candidatus Angelobacter sp.]|nr:VanZ family protein [Candidatus Angelobacter sp.]
MAWLPTAVWLVMIAFFSTDTFSAKHTANILERIINAVYRGISPEQFRILHFFVRKTAHFTVYGLLSWLAFYSWRTTLPRRARWTFTWSVLALLVTLAAGSLDEIHQIFVPSRGPSPYDVMLDVMGAIFVQILIASFAKSPSRQRPSL